MRQFLIMLFMLTGLSGHCFATGEQRADSDASTARVAAPETGADTGTGKQQGKQAKDDKRKPASGEEEPDCE